MMRLVTVALCPLTDENLLSLLQPIMGDVVVGQAEIMRRNGVGDEACSFEACDKIAFRIDAYMIVLPECLKPLRIACKRCIFVGGFQCGGYRNH